VREAVSLINEKIEFLIIGEKATSYKLPLIVEYIKDYTLNNGNELICVETKNINGKYIVFDKNTFLTAINNYNKGDYNNNGNKNKKET
jgi:hypothetical protein